MVNDKSTYKWLIVQRFKGMGLRWSEPDFTIKPRRDGSMKRLFNGQGLRQSILIFAAGVFISTAVMANANESVAIAKKTPPAIAEQISLLKASDKRWIEVNLSTQRLLAWQGNKPAYAVIVSTGKKQTPTPTGSFTLQSKRRLDRMRGADYDLPDVPYALYFYRGYAIHGTYWHNHFGTPVSHGCINVAVNHAQWLFDWAAVGIPIIIHD